MMDNLAFVQTELPWFLPVFIAVIGACVGSFLNVVIYRIPAGVSVIHPGSRCGCGVPIAWHDNIPVLGWIKLAGKARCCGRALSFRYPLVEALTAALFLGCWLKYPPAVALCLMVFCAFMIAQSFIDLDTMEIPDRFSVGGFVLGLVLAGLVPTLHIEASQLSGIAFVDSLAGFISALKGGLLGSALILWIAIIAELILKKDGMGFGDVKLMGAIGAFCGWQGAVFAVFGGALLGSCGVLLMAVIDRLRPAPASTESEASPAEVPSPAHAEAEEEGHRIPFGPALAAGAVVYLLLLREPVQAYFAGITDLLKIY